MKRYIDRFLMLVVWCRCRELKLIIPSLIYLSTILSNVFRRKKLNLLDEKSLPGHLVQERTARLLSSMYITQSNTVSADTAQSRAQNLYALLQQYREYSIRHCQFTKFPVYSISEYELPIITNNNVLPLPPPQVLGPIYY